MPCRAQEEREGNITQVPPIAGFTLIELVLIIVVLGIMATIAIAKYQDLATDA